MLIKNEIKLVTKTMVRPNVEETSQKVFSIGDVIWSKTGRRPFWPCMVTYDPSDGTYTKLVKNNFKEQPIYHVQYFGESSPKHGWTIPGNVIKFKGERAFLTRAIRILKKKYPEDRKYEKGLTRYRIHPSIREKWYMSIKQAERAQKIVNPVERLERYVYDQLR